MTVFSASLPVDMSSLQELSALFSGTLMPGNVVYGPTDITYDVVVIPRVMHVDFSGSFLYDGGHNLIDGTMHAITVAQAGTPAYSIHGFSASVQTLLADAAAPDSNVKVMSFFYNLFSGGDVITGSSGTDFLWGLGGNDTIRGGDGNNFIHGGPGNDVLIGGLGQDEFFFDNKLNKNTNVDTIKHFTPSKFNSHNVLVSAGDHICLAEHVANGFATHSTTHLFYWGENTGKFHSSAFVHGPNTHEHPLRAHNSSQHILYNETNGRLYYDPDGSGHFDRGGHFVNLAPIEFAVLSGHPHLTYHDFTIIA
jgi:Ca2+-binding RTX toxin-like protein